MSRPAHRANGQIVSDIQIFAVRLGEGHFKSCVVDADNYLLLCQRSIELNPVRAGKVESPGAYRRSSYRTKGQGWPAVCWTPHPLYLLLAKGHRKGRCFIAAFFRAQIDEEALKEIHNSANQEMALGNERFNAEIEALSGKSIIHMKRGPQPKVSAE